MTEFETIEKLLFVLQHVPDGIVLLDSSRRVDLTNRTGRAILDELEIELGPITTLGSKPIELLIAAAERGLPADFLVDRGDGRRVVSVRALRPPEGRGETILILRDVSDLRRERVEVATRERFAVMGELAGGIAHDFNNILAIILMQVATYRASPGGANVTELMNAIDDAARAGARVARELLSFGRRERDAHAEVDDLRVTLLTLEQLFGRLLSNVRLAVSVDADVALVAAPAGLVERVLANLILNARDAMPDGGLIEIDARCVDAEFIEVTIDDQGHGIANEHRAQLFDVHFTTKRAGSGHGLAIVASLLREVGGSIEVSERPSGGTRFVIRLRAAQRSA